MNEEEYGQAQQHQVVARDLSLLGLAQGAKDSMNSR
jgi:hypothetical protein|tara:strand:- start:237 stop:344 length:108 start_codon:yes stop_codon:yes gene_type:complete